MSHDVSIANTMEKIDHIWTGLCCTYLNSCIITNCPCAKWHKSSKSTNFQMHFFEWKKNEFSIWTNDDPFCWVVLPHVLMGPMRLQWVNNLGFFFSFLNSSPPGQNGRSFADDIFICIFMNEKCCILVKISLKFVPKGPINNNPALV